MDIKKFKQFFITAGIIYWIIAIMIYVISYEQFHYSSVVSDSLSPAAIVGELTDEVTLTQTLSIPAEQITEIELLVTTFGRTNTGSLNITISDEQNNIISKESIDIATLQDNKYVSIPVEETEIPLNGETLTLKLTTDGCSAGNAISVYFGNAIRAGRLDIVQTLPEAERYQWNETVGNGKLCVRIHGLNTLNFYQTYWLIIAGLFVTVGLLVCRDYKNALLGKTGAIVGMYAIYSKYQFLIKQLVNRDFKVKYKRSVLGMAWSFLNPLLTMAVQYIVFSTLFKSDIPNYPVYLLSGIVLFNYFNEAVSLGMASITGNATLIKKVYVPKYIYPISRLLSSTVSFATSLIPLFLVMLITATPLRPALLLLFFDFFCLMIFVMGMILLMATAMVFFQDTQFLWGVISMIWMYLTPIIYPESIIAKEFLPFYRLNPMYQYVTFARTCIIDGISPAPEAYLGCIVASFATLLLGIWVFRRHQDKFVLYL